MEKLDLTIYSNDIKEIWREFADLPFLNETGREYRKSPLLPEFVWTESLLFVGLNPSFQLKNGTIEDKHKEIGFYPNPQDLDSNPSKDLAYFERFKEVAKYCNQNRYSHLDMLFVRETKLEYIKNLAKTERGVLFINKQLEIFNDILKRMNPKVILVANAFSSELFGKKKSYHNFDKIWLGYDLDFNNDFDQELGCYRIAIDSGKERTPIIFSGMLSGQRALDIGSRERLQWQIKMILGNKKCI